MDTNQHREDDLFDDKIRESLERVSPNYSEGLWDSFERKLEVFEESENYAHPIDKITKEKLANLNIPFNQQHQKLMFKLLDKQTPFNYKLYLAKISEAAVIIIAVLGITYLYNNDNINSVYSLSEQKETNIASKVPSVAIQTKESNKNDKAVVEIEIKNVDKSNFAQAQKNIPSQNNLIVQSDNQEETSTFTFVNNATIAQEQNDKLNNMENEIINSSQENTIANQVISNKITENNQPTTPVSALSAIAFAPLQSIENKSTLVPITLGKMLNNRKFILGIQGSMDLNYVMTPYDIDFGREAYARYASGYGGGLTLGLAKDKWEFGTGVQYTHVQYQPNAVVEIFEGNFIKGEYLAKTIENIELEVLSVPVSVRYTAAKKNRLSFFTNIGATLHTALITNFDRTLKVFDSNSSLVTNPSNLDLESASRSKFDQKTYHSGILEGGNLKHNTYVTADLGIGIEYALSHRLSLFAAPKYQHYFNKNGLGPNNDRFNSLSLNFGARTTL